MKFEKILDLIDPQTIREYLDLKDPTPKPKEEVFYSDGQWFTIDILSSEDWPYYLKYLNGKLHLLRFNVFNVLGKLNPNISNLNSGMECISGKISKEKFDSFIKEKYQLITKDEAFHLIKNKINRIKVD